MADLDICKSVMGSVSVRHIPGWLNVVAEANFGFIEKGLNLAVAQYTQATNFDIGLLRIPLVVAQGATRLF